MRRERKKNRPPTPTTIQVLSEILYQYPPIHGIYRGYARSADGGCALIFIHPSMEEPLRRCTQLFVDGTFRVRVHKVYYNFIFTLININFLLQLLKSRYLDK